MVLVALVGCGSSASSPPPEPTAPVVSNEAPPPPPIAPALARGAELFELRGCVSCHSVDGTARVGATMKGAWGTQVTLSDGTMATFDAAFVRGALNEPHRYARHGFPAGTMPSYEGAFTAEDFEALVAYLQSLR